MTYLCPINHTIKNKKTMESTVRIFTNLDELIAPNTQQAIRQGATNAGVDSVEVRRSPYRSEDELIIDVFDEKENYLFSIVNNETGIYSA